MKISPSQWWVDKEIHSFWHLYHGEVLTSKESREKLDSPSGGVTVWNKHEGCSEQHQCWWCYSHREYNVSTVLTNCQLLDLLPAPVTNKQISSSQEAFQNKKMKRIREQWEDSRSKQTWCIHGACYSPTLACLFMRSRKAASFKVTWEKIYRLKG